MGRVMKWVAGTAMVAHLAMSASASAKETAIEARVVVRDSCPVSKDDYRDVAGLDGQPESFFLPILASIAGSLASSAVSSLAGSLERAAAEHTFKATATTGFELGRIVRDDRQGLTPFAYREEPHCLVIAVPDPSESKKGREAPVALADLEKATDGIGMLASDSAKAELRSVLGEDMRLANVPLAYAEVAVLPAREGTEIVPLLLWYRKPLSGTQGKSQRAELHVTLATPGYAASGDPLGTVYAFSRFQLPRLTPSDSEVLGYNDMRFSNPIYHASRPAGDAIKVVPIKLNSVIAAHETRKAELAKARADLASAEAKLADESTEVNRNAVWSHRAAVTNAELALERAEKAINTLPGTASPDLNGYGRTNVRVSFLVVRDENKFLAAIAKALGAQAETAATSVNGLIAPKAEWEATDTAYITATTELASAQRALDSALAGGDPNATASAQGALLVAKAKINEAAVNAGRLPPFPNIIPGG